MTSTGVAFKLTANIPRNFEQTTFVTGFFQNPNEKSTVQEVGREILKFGEHFNH